MLFIGLPAGISSSRIFERDFTGLRLVSSDPWCKAVLSDKCVNVYVGCIITIFVLYVCQKLCWFTQTNHLKLRAEGHWSIVHSSRHLSATPPLYPSIHPSIQPLYMHPAPHLHHHHHHISPYHSSTVQSSDLWGDYVCLSASLLW